MSMISISVEGGDKLLQELCHKKSQIRMKYNLRFLKSCTARLLPSSQSGRVPPNWRSVVVALVYKKDPKSKQDVYIYMSMISKHM